MNFYTVHVGDNKIPIAVCRLEADADALVALLPDTYRKVVRPCNPEAEWFFDSFEAPKPAAQK